MKCLILAGGTGDTLWPLSRKNYPKQFMNIKEGRSLLQETIVRNMTFCDEFIIITNENYLNIVEGQMKAFQGLRYRVILEGSHVVQLRQLHWDVCSATSQSLYL